MITNASGEEVRALLILAHLIQLKPHVKLKKNVFGIHIATPILAATLRQTAQHVMLKKIVSLIRTQNVLLTDVQLHHLQRMFVSRISAALGILTKLNVILTNALRWDLILHAKLTLHAYGILQIHNARSNIANSLLPTVNAKLTQSALGTGITVGLITQSSATEEDC